MNKIKKISEILSRQGARAGIINLWREFNIPKAKAARPIAIMKGKRIRVRVMVKESFSGFLMKPGAIKRTIMGEKMIPRIVKIDRRIKSSKPEILASLCASSLGLVVKYSVKTGIKDAESAPSPRSWRRRLGMR
jgi:hypothetical protein